MTLHFYWTSLETRRDQIIDINSHFWFGVYCASELEG